ncbi:MAG: FAD-dependent oxidoreductase [Nitrospinota bacterium]|nr:FAD-dependent oxidoreductase [Nitrospinota bacterium]
MNTEIKEISCDVLVIGGGVAGMLASIEAKKEDVEVILITKATFPSGSSSMARGGFSSALGHENKRDNPRVHWHDTIKGGYEINNPKLVKVMTEEVIERTYTIDSWGLGLIKKENGNYDQRKNADDTYARFLHCAGMIGKPLMSALSKKVKELGVRVESNVFIIDLILENDGSIAGAWGVKHKEDIAVMISSKSTVLCSGGAPQLHEVNDSPPQVTGDGYAMAFRAGTELLDMEMIDYQLMTGWPKKMIGYNPYATGFIRIGSHLKNKDGFRFMQKWNPNAPNQCYEQTARSLFNRGVGFEIFEGRGTEHGTVYMDASHCMNIDHGGEIEIIKRAFKNGGVDITKESMEVCSGPHTFLGGIRIDEFGRTNVPSLYAGGEAGGGIHGSNRLSGAALADSFVFGSRSGKNAAKDSKRRRLAKPKKSNILDRLSSLFNRIQNSGNLTAKEYRLSLQKNVFTNIGQIRSKEKLHIGLEKLDDLKKNSVSILNEKEKPISKINELKSIVETDNLIEVAKMLAISALTREESRGGHYRCDFPETDNDNWKANIVISKKIGTEEIQTRVNQI